MNTCLCRHQRHPERDIRGFVGLMTIIILGAIILTVGLASAYTSQTQILMSGLEMRRVSAHDAAVAGIEDAAYRLRRDPSFTGGTIPVGALTTTITVSGSGNSRTVQSTAIDGEVTATIQATLNRRQNTAGNAYGWVVEEWREI